MTAPIRGFLDGLKPIKRLAPSAWADTYRYLSSAAAASAGRWKTSKTPYLKDIMDDFDPYSPVREVILMKGAQLGGTEVGYNIVGYYIDMDPCPIMSVMPTENTAKRNSKMRLDPMIKASPSLEAKISAAKTRDKGNTILQKDFPGGVLVISGANSGVALRSVPIRIMILDETDGFPLDLDGEGSPVDLAKARTRTFPNSKVFQLSTPTLELTSHIAKEFESTDKRFYYVPCPECKFKQKLTWPHVVFDSAKKVVNEAHYKCVECGHLIPERKKPWMLKHGEWVSEAPDNLNPTRKGYHLNSLYSPLGWYSWAEAARDFLKAKRTNDQNKLKVFTNTVLAETWKEKAVAPKYEHIYERRGPYQKGHVPAEVCVITAGVDVQQDRLELEIVGWGRGLKSWSIDYVVIHGPTNETDVWNKLRSVLYRNYEREDGSTLGISKMAVDSGFNTNHVYNFCRPLSRSIVIPVKGQPNRVQRSMLRPPQPVDIRANGQVVGTMSLWNIGVDIIKTELYGALNSTVGEDGEAPDLYCHFPKDYDMHYFKMLTAERLVKRKNTKGYWAYVWETIRDRNEALDCRVYARAALAVVGADRWTEKAWQAVQRKPYANTSEVTNKRGKKRAKKRGSSSFWDN